MQRWSLGDVVVGSPTNQILGLSRHPLRNAVASDGGGEEFVGQKLVLTLE